MWLGRRDDISVITTVVLPRGNGVIGAPYQWQVAPEVMGVITQWARPQALVMLGLFHIHVGCSVAMSWSDRNRVVQVPGMLSVIAGEKGREADLDRWGWYLYEGGEYRGLTPTERQLRIRIDDSSPCPVWAASTDGIREVVDR